MLQVLEMVLVLVREQAEVLVSSHLTCERDTLASRLVDRADAAVIPSHTRYSNLANFKVTHSECHACPPSLLSYRAGLALLSERS